MRTLRSLFARKVQSPVEPAGPALSRAQSLAFVVQHPGNLKDGDWIEPAKARGATVDVLPLERPCRDADGRLTSFVHTPPRPDYDCIVVSRRIDMFEHSWSYAFLDRLNTLLAPGGTIYLARCHNPARQIPDARLAALFGRAPSETGRLYQAFARAPGGLDRPKDAALSTLDAYWPLMDTLIHSRFDARLKDVVRTLGPVKPAERRPESDLYTLLTRESYRNCSALTKSAMLQFVIACALPGRDGLHLVDVGAGTGINAMEMLLNPSGVEFVTLVEINRRCYLPAAAVYDRLGENVRGRLALVGEAGERFAARPADVVFVSGVFSPLAPEKRGDFADNCWANIAPGGILVVLENMKKGAGDRRDNERLTPPQIDALLGRFGPLRYFRADAKAEVTRDEAGQDTVFRVVRK